jgi:SagB-type dehydrogenase family enzyme
MDPIEAQLLRDQADAAWELFHENSKMSRYERRTAFPLPPTDQQVVQTMNRLRSVKPYRDFPKVPLPTKVPASRRSFDEVLLGRVTARGFGPGAIDTEELAKVLFMGYGVTRDNADTHFPRPFRAVPSGGALYPLEIYLHATRMNGLPAGLYHYDPEDYNLDVLRLGDESSALAEMFFQPDLVRGAAAILIVSAVFLRSTFKYGDRGYRFALIEAGHLAQNVVLTAFELGVAAAPVGGFLDRDLDRYLGFDGLMESVVYVILLGREASAQRL